MEILKILEASTGKLYPEDIDFFETELATGNYSEKYVKQCRKKLKEIRKWLSDRSTDRDRSMPSKVRPQPSEQGTVIIELGDIVPAGVKSTAVPLSGEQLIFQDINLIRQSNAYKSEFKEYLLKTKELDTDFVDAHYSFFQQWELDAIVSVMQLGETFLEKYFDALDHDKIARYQKFSEQFFIKHFSDLEPLLVLKHGKNAWRKKPNRSKQLDIFLRLKGIKI